MNRIYKLFEKILFALVVSSFLFAETPSCLSNIDHGKIQKDLKKDGSVLIEDCHEHHPNLFITITDLDDPRNIIAITHAPKTSKGYPLKTIAEHARREERVSGNKTILAINGYTWEGDSGQPWKFYEGKYAERPRGTVQSKGKILYRRNNGKDEVVTRFSKRSNTGTKASMSIGVNEPVAFNADNSSTSIMLNGQPRGSGDSLTSSMGIGKYNRKKSKGVEVKGSGNNYNSKGCFFNIKYKYTPAVQSPLSLVAILRHCTQYNK